MNNTTDSSDALSMFGLTKKQTRVLFSIERLLVQEDINKSKDGKLGKEKWLKEWTSSILDYLLKVFPDESSSFMTKEEISDVIAYEHSINQNNTWYYLIFLEVTTFVPYTLISNYKKDNKKYAKLKYKKQIAFIKELVRNDAIMEEFYVDRFEKTYSKSISKLTGKTMKIVLSMVSAITISAITAATAGALSGPIALAIYGSNFVGLFGASLTSACLAMAGGGAIAVGGAGMAGGVLVIVGGGALLGLAGGGTVVVGVNLLVASTPELALTQAAKLEVVLKEIILNAQSDINYAQEVLESYKTQIVNLHAYVAKIRLEQQKDKKMIAELEKSIKYMEKAYENMNKFSSSYAIEVESKE
jgi:hypothetical protein